MLRGVVENLAGLLRSLGQIQLLWEGPVMLLMLLSCCLSSTLGTTALRAGLPIFYNFFNTSPL